VWGGGAKKKGKKSRKRDTKPTPMEGTEQDREERSQKVLSR
jgi:hypothetical protein